MEATAVAPAGAFRPRTSGSGVTNRWRRSLASCGSWTSRAPVAGIQLAHAGARPRRCGRGTGAARRAVSRRWERRRGAERDSVCRGRRHAARVDRGGDRGNRHGVRRAARRALAAGYRVVEVHAGTVPAARIPFAAQATGAPTATAVPSRIGTRIVVEVVDAVRAVWPEELPLFVRILRPDWIDGAWDVAQTVDLARILQGSRRRSRGLLLRRERSGREDPAGSRIPGALCRTGSP